MISNENYLAIDTETTGPSFEHGCRAFAISMCSSEGSEHYFDAPVDPLTRLPKWTFKQRREVKDLIRQFDTHVFHNCLFDLAALIYFDPTLEKTFRASTIHDTMVLSHILDSKSPKALKFLARAVLKIDTSDEEQLDAIIKQVRGMVPDDWQKAKIGHPHFPGHKGKLGKLDMWLPKAWAESDSFEGDSNLLQECLTVCQTYAQRDALRTAGLFNIFTNSLNQDPESIPAYELQQANIWPLYDMERTGLHLLPRKFKAVVRKYEKEATGFKDRMCFLVKNPDFNPNSSHQKSRALTKFKFKLEKEAKLSTDKDPLFAVGRPILMGLRSQENSIQAENFLDSLLHYGEVNSALNYLHSYERFRLGDNLYPRMNLVGTSTTRLSSAQPNGQNVGKGKERDELDDKGKPIIEYSLRQVFGPSRGNRWYAIDYDQLQIRIFAFLSGEKTLVQAIRDGFDFHEKVAKDLFGVAHPTKSQRKVAKYINFALIFGGGKSRIDSLAGIRGTYDRFASLYPNVVDYIDRTCEEVREKGYVRTASGYPLSVPADKAYVGVNYRVQGTEGDIVKLALSKIHTYLKEHHPDDKILLQVHDEFLFESINPPSKFPIKKLCSLMEEAGTEMGVECVAKPELILKNWGAGKPLSTGA